MNRVKTCKHCGNESNWKVCKECYHELYESLYELEREPELDDERDEE